MKALPKKTDEQKQREPIVQGLHKNTRRCTGQKNKRSGGERQVRLDLSGGSGRQQRSSAAGQREHALPRRAIREIRFPISTSTHTRKATVPRKERPFPFVLATTNNVNVRAKFYCHSRRDLRLEVALHRGVEIEGHLVVSRRLLRLPQSRESVARLEPALGIVRQRLGGTEGIFTRPGNAACTSQRCPGKGGRGAGMQGASGAKRRGEAGGKVVVHPLSCFRTNEKSRDISRY